MIKYCIHLEDRSDREKLMGKEFEKHNVQVTYFPAIRRKPGWIGCRDSHLEVLKFCKEHRDNYDYYKFMVLEDDVKFTS